MAMAEPPPTMDVDHDNELPKKKKPKCQEKPVPTFLQDLDILNLHECEITSQQISVKGEDGSEELLAVGTTVAKDGFIVHLEKDLSAHQLRKIVCQIGISKANLMKMQCRYDLLKTSQEMGTISRHDDKDTSTQCRVINVIFHRDFIDGFLSYNDGRSRAIQETGNGSQFQRFWVHVANAVNGGESTPQKTLTEKEIPKQQQEEAEDSVEYVLTDEDYLNDEDSSLPINSEIDPYSELEERPDNNAKKTYNNHVVDAKLNGVDPAVSNTAKVMEKEVESLFKGFLSIRKFMAAAMKTSGSHDSDPMQYTRRAISKSKTTKISTFLLSTFSAEVRKYRTSVSPFLLYWHPLWWQTACLAALPM